MHSTWHRILPGQHATPTTSIYHTADSITNNSSSSSRSLQHNPPPTPDRYSRLLQLSPLQHPLMHPSSNLFAFLLSFHNHLAAATALQPYSSSSVKDPHPSSSSLVGV
jgi:hypothetical protein